MKYSGTIEELTGYGPMLLSRLDPKEYFSLQHAIDDFKAEAELAYVENFLGQTKIIQAYIYSEKLGILEKIIRLKFGQH